MQILPGVCSVLLQLGLGPDTKDLWAQVSIAKAPFQRESHLVKTLEALSPPFNHEHTVWETTGKVCVPQIEASPTSPLYVGLNHKSLVPDLYTSHL